MKHRFLDNTVFQHMLPKVGGGIDYAVDVADTYWLATSIDDLIGPD